MKKFLKSGRFYLWAGMLIPALIVLAGFIVIKVWPFGDGTVLIIDSLHQYLPFYTDLHEKLTQGDSLFYSFSGGLGYNFWATWAYYMASPLNLLIALVPTANVGDFMDLMILLKIGACGGIFSWYLHRRRPDAPGLPLVFGTMYALGNFLIGYYFNLMWLDSMAVTPLILYGIEQLVHGKRGRIYGLSLFYAIWCNYYIGFMLCIFSCLYLLVCLVQEQGMTVGKLLRRCLTFGVYSLLAGGMAGVVLLPAYRALSASESMLSNTFPRQLRFYTDFFAMFRAHFISEHPINISDSQVGFNAYCGCAALILIWCYALDQKISLRRKLPHLLLTALLFMSVTVNILNYIWHGFHTQNGLPNRFAFLYVLMLLLLCFDVFPDLPSMAAWKLCLSGAVPLGLSCYLVLSGRADMDTYGNWVYLTPALLAFYLLLILVIRARRACPALPAFMLGSLMFSEAALHGIYGIMYNENVTRSIYLKDQASYRSLMKQQGDTDFFRAEIDSQRMRNVGMFAGARSMVLFNSTMQEAVTAFCDALGIEARTNKNGYNGVTRLMNDVFGIRYVLSSNGKAESLYQFPKIGGDDNLQLYKNENALSVGFLADEWILDWETLPGDPIGTQNDFAYLAAGVENLYVLDRVIEAEDGTEYGVKVPDQKQVYLYVPDRIEEFRLQTPEYSRTYSTYTDHLYTVNAEGASNLGYFTCELKSTQTAERVSVYTCPDERYQKVRDHLAKSQLKQVRATGSSLSGTIDADRDGVLVLTIPYDKGWSVKVDGKAARAVEIGGALTGLELTEGRHQISMNYTPAGFAGGLWLTGICTGVFILLQLLSGRSGQRRITALPSPEPHFEGERSLAGAGDPSQEQENTEESSGEDMKMDESIITGLRGCNPKGRVLLDEPMREHTTFRVGGPADCFVEPGSEEELVRTIAFCREHALPCYVIGNGSNLLVGDRGFRGVIVRLGGALAQIDAQGDCIRAGAGALLKDIADTAARNGLAGLEFASGIPGSLGGAVLMNAGAYGGEMKDVVRSVRVLTREGEIEQIPGSEMGFGYRTSLAQTQGQIVLGALLSLHRGDREQIQRTVDDLTQRRAMKQPLEKASAGSTFKRPEGYFAGKLIMDAGLRGFSLGGAQVSDKHCGFVINNGEATAAEVAALIAEVQKRVYEHSGVRLEPEVRRIGEF